ncbi:MAG: hypothetical protein R3C49_15850 [Planctomycetaceae bacterium]
MNQVLSAQRQSEAKLVQARTQAEMERIQSETQAEIHRTTAAAETEVERHRRDMERDAARQTAESEAQIFAKRRQAAELLEQHPMLLRLLELESLRDIAQNSNARIYVGFDRPTGDAIRVQD